MAINNFKTGDRVVFIGDVDSIKGKVGTVIDTNMYVYVEFDDYIGGHSLDGRCKLGHGWYCSFSHLKDIDHI